MKDLNNYHFIDQLKAKNSIEKIILFGSRARGNERRHSDIDLAILFNSNCKISKEWQATLEIIENADTLLPIDCINLNTITSESLRKNIKNEGKILFSRK